MDTSAGRIVLSIFRLLRNKQDHLAWRTLLTVRPNNIGETKIGSLIEYAQTRTLTFADALILISNDPSQLGKHGEEIAEEHKEITGLVEQLGKTNLAELTSEAFEKLTVEIVSWATETGEERQNITDYIKAKATGLDEPFELSDAVSLIEASDESIEQEIDAESVNMLTMHKAKGLTSRAVIVMACEDEHIPGRAEEEPEFGDERRLLFVSLSRAKHKLYVTYCNERTGQQMQMGSSPGNPRRSLTRFLRHGNARIVPANEFFK